MWAKIIDHQILDVEYRWRIHDIPRMVIAIDTKKSVYFEKPLAKGDFVQECYPSLRFKRTVTKTL